MPTIGCAMIVRDNQDTLPRALASVRPHVNELVILDTGSTDATVDIALQSADCVASSPWNDHFGQMRQRALDMLSTDWAIWLDSDDELMDGESLGQLAADAPDQLGAYLMQYVLEQDAQGQPGMQMWRERLFRRERYRWTGRIHEVLEPRGEGAYMRASSPWVLHHGHGDGTASMARNIRLLRMAVDEEPNNDRYLFYLGRDLVVSGAYAEGREYLLRYLPLSKWADEAFTACQFIGYTHRYEKDYEAAYRADLRSLEYRPLWPLGYYALAQDCYFMQRWEESDHYCQIGRLCNEPDTNLFLNPAYLRTGWMIYQSVSLWHLGRILEALSLTKEALELLPGDVQHIANAKFFAAELRKAGAVPLPAPAGVS